MTQNITKICIIGDKCSGKTAFVNASLGGVFVSKYIPSKNTITTDASFYRNKKNYHICINELIDIIDQQYDAIIIVFDLTRQDSFQYAIDQYREVVKTFAKPIVIIGTKNDMSNIEIENKDIRKYFKISTYFEVSNKYKINLNGPFEYIMNKLYEA